MKKIKVAYFTVQWTVGGAEKLIYAMAKHLNRECFEVIAISLKDSPQNPAIKDDLTSDFQKAGVKVLSLGMKHRLDFSALMRLGKILTEEKPDILHTHLFFPDQYGRILGKLCKVPVITSTVHMLERIRQFEPFRSLDRWTSQFCDHLIAVSHEVKKALSRVEKIASSKIEVIPNAIDYTSSAVSVIKEEKRREIGIPENAFVVGMVSRLEGPRKGHRILFKALSQLTQTIPDLHCVIAGDGPDRQALESLADSLGIKGQVHFLGTRHDVDALLKSFDLFVLPSFLEGSPMVLIEALAAGLPCVATPVGGVPEMIFHDQNGKLVPPGDSKALAIAIEFLHQHPDAREAMGKVSLEIFQKTYDMKNAVKTTEAFYGRLLAAKNHPKIKVLIAATAFDTGGVTTSLKNLLQGYSRETFEITLISGNQDLRNDLIQGLALPHHLVSLVKPVSPFQDLKALWQLYQFMRRHSFDIVHTHNCKADFLGGLAARMAKIPMIVSTAHGALKMGAPGSLKQAFFDFLEKISYRHFHHHIISVSQATTEDLLAKKKVLPLNVSTIPNGIPLSPAFNLEQKIAKRKTLGISDNQKVVLSVMRLKYPKAPEVLVKSLQSLVHENPEIISLIVGEGPDHEKIQSLIEVLDLKKNVRLLGQRSDIVELLQIADIFVLPTYSEGLSISILEAMSAGLPVIASEVGGNTELLGHGAYGKLFPAHDNKALSEAIAFYLKNPAAAAEDGKKLQARVLNDFSLPYQVKETSSLLKQILEQRKSKKYLERIQDYLSEEGWDSTFRKLKEKILAPFFYQVRLWFLGRLDHEPVGPLPTRLKIKLRQAQVCDLPRMEGLLFEKNSASAKRLKNPMELCFIAEYENRIIAVQWVLLGGGKGFHIYAFHQNVLLSRDEAYLHDSRTLREFRGQGVMNTLQQHIWFMLKDQGYKILYTDVMDTNETSIGLLEKLGLRRVEHTTFTRILGFPFIQSRRLRDLADFPASILIVSKAVLPPNHWTRFLDKKYYQADFLTTIKSDPGFLRHNSNKRKFDLIHFEDYDELSLKTVTDSGKKRFTLALSNESFEKIQKIDHALFRNCQKIITRPGVDSKEISTLFGVDEEKIEILTERALSDFNGSLPVSEAREKLKLSVTDKVIAAMTSLDGQSHLWQFFSVCESLKEKHPDCQILVASDTPQYLSMKLYLEDTPALKSVRLLRRGYDRRYVVKAVDTLVITHDSPENSLAVLEAAASSKPVVCMSPVSRIRQKKHPQLSVSYFQKEEEAKKIIGSLDAVSPSPELVEENFSSKHYALQISALWTELLMKDLISISNKHWKDYGHSTFSRKSI